MVGREIPDERTLEEAIARLYSPGARAELIRVLTSPSNVRADVIRQFHERGRGEMVEMLALLEEEGWKRRAIIEALRRLDDS